MSVHTIYPVPWKFTDMLPEKPGELWVVDFTGEPFAFFGDMEECNGEDIDNAKLFAAGPDLLRASEYALSFIKTFAPTTMSGYGFTVATLHDAIRKAKEGDR